MAKDFFDTDVTMDILDVNQEEERTGKKEHVVSDCAKVTRTDEKGKAKGITRQSGQPARPRGTGCTVFSESTVSLGSDQSQNNRCKELHF